MPYSSISDLPDNIKQKPESKQRQWMAVWNSSYAACVKGGGSTAKCEGEAFAKANGVIKGAEMAEEAESHQAHEEAWGLQLEKADDRIKYRAAAEGNDSCSGCRFYDAMCLKCSVVEGSIDPAYTCDLWTKPMSAEPIAEPEEEEDDDEPPMMDSGGDFYYNEQPFQLFVDATALFADDDFSKPQWIPFLPSPGKYQHPVYGEINITQEFNQLLVDSVKQRIYQENIPLDVEHETKLSGAVGWIKDMRMNENGSSDAYVEWTERGRALLKGGQFKYVSPEWFSAWRDPATGVIHRNVVAGGAITTRPFFKEKVLRALVASETGAQIIKSDKEDKHVAETTQVETPPAPVTYTAAEVDSKIKEATQPFAEQLSDLTTKLSEAQALATTEKEAREAMEAKLAERDKADRRRRFTDMAAGRGGSGDGAAWVGDAEKHVAILEVLADQFGEEHEALKSYIEQQSAIAIQFKQSDVFKEFGTATSGAVSDPEKKLDSLAKAKAEKDNKPYEQAYAEILETDEGRRLYAEI